MNIRQKLILGLAGISLPVAVVDALAVVNNKSYPGTGQGPEPLSH